MFKDLGNYIVYSDGRIWSKLRSKFLKPRFSHKGYAHVRMNSKTVYVHKLIAVLFIPNPNNLPQVDHRDNDKSNNSISNLQWCDGSFNMKKSWKDGNHKPKLGSSNPASKLTEDDVIKIKYELKHLNQNEICKMFNISTRTVARIRDGITWKHI